MEGLLSCNLGVDLKAKFLISAHTPPLKCLVLLFISSVVAAWGQAGLWQEGKGPGMGVGLRIGCCSWKGQMPTAASLHWLLQRFFRGQLEFMVVTPEDEQLCCNRNLHCSVGWRREEKGMEKKWKRWQRRGGKRGEEEMEKGVEKREKGMEKGADSSLGVTVH